MNSTLSFFLSTPENGPISDDEFQIATDVFTVMWSIISFLGLISNAINIRTFIAMGLEDGVTISFLTLSITDMGFSMASFAIAIAFVFSAIEDKFDLVFPIQPFAVASFSAQLGFLLYSITGMTTTFISVARCMCVAKPFIFRNVFTRSRSVIAFVTFSVISTSFYAQVLSQMGTVHKFDKSVNESRHVIWYSDIREDVRSIVDLTMDTILFFVSQTIIIFCIIVTVECLRRSGEFRQTASSGHCNIKKSSNKLSGKELKVVHQVVLISAIYIVCSIPKLDIIYGFVAPGYGVNKFSNVYFLMGFLRTTVELINSTSTFPVYYVFNTKFRSLCFSKAVSGPK